VLVSDTLPDLVPVSHIVADLVLVCVTVPVLVLV
jgi:hypothetical protein